MSNRGHQAGVAASAQFLLRRRILGVPCVMALNAHRHTVGAYDSRLVIKAFPGMNRTAYWTRLTALLVPLFFVAGCSWRLKEVTNRWKFGVEARHQRANDTDDERYSEETGFDFKWANDWKTGISYRRRDSDEGNGDGEDGVWIDFAFPVWKARPKPDANAQRIAELEQRLAQLEVEQASRATRTAGADASATIGGANN